MPTDIFNFAGGAASAEVEKAKAVTRTVAPNTIDFFKTSDTFETAERFILDPLFQFETPIASPNFVRRSFNRLELPRDYRHKRSIDGQAPKERR